MLATGGRIAGPVSLYCMVETYGCADFAGSARASRYDGGDVSPTAGASLTFGRRYGARFIVHLGEASGDTPTLFQMGGYVSF